MRTSPRRNKVPAFGLVDALVGLFLLAATSSALFSGYSTFLALEHRQEAKADALVKTIDAGAYEPWL